MKQIIVTTTIHPPTQPLSRFLEKPGWDVIVVGDKKTPHDSYQELARRNSHLTYLAPEEQQVAYPRISDALGWNTIQRRNIGFIVAYKMGADVVASVDDDNLPYENWGQDLLVGRETEVDIYEPEAEVFDPLSVTEHHELWHRGYPVELLPARRKVHHLGKQTRKVLVQADLWDGDPDIDAITRLTWRPEVTFPPDMAPYAATKLSPFNSQNTFLAREVLPYYAVLPHVGRMDDIWGGYLLQHHFPDSIIYNAASVRHERHEQDLVRNLEDELIGYRQTLSLVHNLAQPETVLPAATVAFLDLYRAAFQ
jgi:hypothetical protein